MSRSGYGDECDECDGWDLIRWRGAVMAAVRGERGQAMLRDLAAALDAMPVKELIAEELETPEGVCALGCLGRARGMEMGKIDPEDSERVAKQFNIAPALAKEIVYMNDEYGCDPTPAARFKFVREWIARQLLPVPA